MAATEKTIPVPDELTQPYWDAAKEHRYVLQRCTACGTFAAWPRVICPRCHGDAFEWAAPSGKGKIHSYTILRQTTRSGFTDEIPFVIVNVEIADDPTCIVTTNLLVDESEYDKLHVDLPVVVTFEDRGEVTVPQFKLA